MIPQTVSHFRILDKLGEGGMGTVYLAEDQRLNRRVAVKILPAEFSHDMIRLARFEREAKILASLNHANIAAIYGLEEEDERRLLILELVEGETLAQRLRLGPVPLNRALDIARQIANGLESAHARGIIHRDLKPANVMIADGGGVKILDFGLAKPVEPDPPASLSRAPTFAADTRAGAILGTFPYMSPQQARGESVDKRADIWAFGCVLYEMLTGRQTFPGETAPDVLGKVLETQPDWSLLPEDVPGTVRSLLRHTLQKDLGQRLHDIADARLEIEDVLAGVSVGQIGAPAKQTAGNLARGVSLALAAALLAVLVVAGLALLSPQPFELRIERTLPLTSAPGLEERPTWSSDGTRIAYAGEEGGNMDVWVRQVSGGQAVSLTGSFDGFDGNPAWSPDGQWIAFVSARDGGGIFVVAALGGPPRRVVPLYFDPSLDFVGMIPTLSWSADGRNLAFTTWSALFTVPAFGGVPQRVPHEPQEALAPMSEPAWSPDGTRLAYTEFTGTGTSVSTIWSLRVDGSDARPLTEGTSLDHQPYYSRDGRRLFFISDRGGTPDVWWIELDAKGSRKGPARPLTAGVGVGSFALTADETMLAYAKVVERSNIYSVPADERRVLTLEDAQPITMTNHVIEFIDVSPDGEWIAFDSNRSGNADIWLMRRDGGELEQVTTHRAHDWFPRFSPDGRRLAFYSLRDGNRNLYLTPVGGGAVTQLTDDPAKDWFPNWSPDGREIAFCSYRTGNSDVWIISQDGGEPRQVTFHEGIDSYPVWSPGGDLLAFSSNRDRHWEIFLVPARGGRPRRLTNAAWFRLNLFVWSADGRTIYTQARGIGPQALWSVRVKDGTVRPLMEIRGSQRPYQSLAVHGDRLYFPLWERLGDLWLAELTQTGTD